MIFWQGSPTHAEGGYVGYWKFDQAEAGNPEPDMSGNGNDLTPVGNPAPSLDRPSRCMANKNQL